MRPRSEPQPQDVEKLLKSRFITQKRNQLVRKVAANRDQMSLGSLVVKEFPVNETNRTVVTNFVKVEKKNRITDGKEPLIKRPLQPR